VGIVNKLSHTSIVKSRSAVSCILIRGDILSNFSDRRYLNCGRKASSKNSLGISEALQLTLSNLLNHF